jgi:hypothetical protein
MPSDPRTAAILGAVAAAIVVLVVVAIVVKIVRAMARRTASRVAVTRARRAGAGERRAIEMLRAAGYEVIEEQCCLDWTFACDGEPVTVELRCDAVVARDGRRLVAEVKTGERAPSLTTAATRRQLLEYAVAYRADGVLLVDPEAGLIHEVDFDLGAS